MALASEGLFKFQLKTSNHSASQASIRSQLSEIHAQRGMKAALAHLSLTLWRKSIS